MPAVRTSLVALAVALLSGAAFSPTAFGADEPIPIGSTSRADTPEAPMTSDEREKIELYLVSEKARIDAEIERNQVAAANLRKNLRLATQEAEMAVKKKEVAERAGSARQASTSPPPLAPPPPAPAPKMATPTPPALPRLELSVVPPPRPPLDQKTASLTAPPAPIAPSYAPPVATPVFRNYCTTPTAVFGPESVKEIGAPCTLNGVDGVVIDSIAVDVFDLMKKLETRAQSLEDKQLRLYRLSTDVFELMKKLKSPPQGQEQPLDNIRAQIQNLAALVNEEAKKPASTTSVPSPPRAPSSPTRRAITSF